MALRFYGSGAAAVFAPLETLSRSELVARRLTDAIALGLVPDSGQLPGETDLAGIFGVSTTTIREALSSLRQRGLIDTRRGRGGGSFVRAHQEMTTAIVRDRLAELSLAQLRDLGDHYGAIAGTAARLAAERATSDDVRRLTAVCDSLENAEGLGGRRRADAQFHIEVAATAQSTRLYRAEVSLQAEVGTLLWLAFGDDESHRRTVLSCRDVVAAIGRTDGDAARTAAEVRVADSTARLIDLRLALEDT
ncbi:FadR/GntR family transcriptional regulator [Kribbella sp. NPDC051586]|uniref:FadR/GntR family transcriptional regulator n=1 Tax=Kribbella sp. NPDC051586 TaxID=3364118 RepID=UPI0037AD6359